MSASIENQKITLNKLRRLLADAEATVSGLKLRIAKAEAKLTGEPVPVAGLDVLWKHALAIARNRSSKHLCRKAWNMIPRNERPTVEVMVHALKIWNRSPEWKKDGNQYVMALDRWIKERRWEDLPEVEAAPSRYPTAPKPLIKSAPEASATPEEIAEILGALKPRRMQS